MHEYSCGAQDVVSRKNEPRRVCRVNAFHDAANAFFISSRHSRRRFAPRQAIGGIAGAFDFRPRRAFVDGLAASPSAKRPARPRNRHRTGQHFFQDQTNTSGDNAHGPHRASRNKNPARETSAARCSARTSTSSAATSSRAAHRCSNREAASARGADKDVARSNPRATD